MAQDLNHFSILARLTDDVELKTTASGSEWAQFSIACTGRERNDAGEWADRPDFFNCKAFGRTAQTLARFGGKGRRFVFEGRMKQERWQNEQGQNRSSITLIINSVYFADSKKQDDSGGDDFPVD